MPPFLDCGRDSRPGFEYGEVQPSVREVCGCREADRARADDDDRRRCAAALDERREPLKARRWFKALAEPNRLRLFSMITSTGDCAGPPATSESCARGGS
ncbi:hypothetical protein GCM10009630_12640 [Kribbella jejuensis]